MNEQEQNQNSRGRGSRSSAHEQRGAGRGGQGRRGSGRGRGRGSGGRGEAGDQWGRSRMRRGDVRAALLVALLDGPAHGYELIQRLETKTAGRWRPSPGSVYPQLQMLADEDLLSETDRDGKRVFELTSAGRTQAEERVAAGDEPWATMEQGDRGGLRSAVRDLLHATKQIGLSGSPATVERATEIVKQARKDLYLLLAES